MNGANQSNRSGMTILGFLLAVGLTLGGLVLGGQIKATRLSDRYVTVRGLAERNVKSDLAIWNLGYKDAGDDLGALYTKSEADKKAILDFLGKQGIQPSEIELGIVGVTDTQANEYGINKNPSRRYIMQQDITVHTSRVDLVAAASQKTMQLVQKGVVLSGGTNSGLSYEFTGLNSIKPDMITEATRNARAAAERFASDSGSRVGSIRQATQGIFSIVAANSGGDTGGEYGYQSNDESNIMKTVRVVTSVEYYLDK
ncbi:MAG: SIMPL domain-containing protein [Candidatus Acidiferrales bacterium]